MMKLRVFLSLALLLPLACAKSVTEDFDDDGDSDGSGGAASTTTGDGGALVTGAGGATVSGSGGSGGMACPQGYEPSGGDCVDIDECTDGTDDCDPLVTCVNDEPGFHCEPCPMGTTDVNGDGTQCDDIDECADGTDDCDPLAGCINDEPGFHCGPCPTGTTDVNGDGTLCQPDGVIGLDARHGFDATVDNLATGSKHAQMRTAITTAGMTYQTLNSLTAANLSGLSAVFVQQPYDSNSSLLSATEITDLVAFVNAGGGLLIIGDGGSGSNAPNINQLAQNWGVTYSSSHSWASGMAFSNLVSHAVTTGVNSFGVDYGPPMTTVNAPAVALSSGVALAAVTGAAGSGNVVFVSDSLFNNSAGADYNINSLDNAVLLDNILTFLAL
jgi:hypothetical protein